MPSTGNKCYKRDYKNSENESDSEVERLSERERENNFIFYHNCV